MPSPPMPPFRDMHVLLWSPSQQCFDRLTVGEMLQKNWDAFYYQKYHETDWVVVGFLDTPTEAAALQKSMMKRFDEGAPGEPHIHI